MCRSSVLLATIALCLSAAFVVPSVLAEAPTDASEQLAEEGYKLRVQSRDAEALAKFEAAYALRATPRYLAQIALAEQALGRWVLAHEHLTAALGHASDPWITKWNADLQTTLKKMENELATLEVACNVPGTVIAIAGREVGRTPLAGPLYVAAGTIAIDLSADGYLPVSHVVTTVRGQLSRIDVTLIARTHPEAIAAAAPLAPASPAPTAAPPPVALSPAVDVPAPIDARDAARPASNVAAQAEVKTARQRDLRWLYYGVSGGAAVALTGAIVYAVAGTKADGLEKACYDDWCEADELDERRQNVRALDRASWALLPIGIAAMLGSGAAYYWWPTPAGERQARALQVNASGDATRVMVHGKVEF